MPDHPQTAFVVATFGTLAGNLQIADIIVVDAARRSGIVTDWRRHARTDVQVTLLALALTAAWLAWRHP